MAKRRRTKRNANYWQSADMNSAAYQTNLQWITELAMNRFRWVGLPDTCDERFLEQTLLTNGMATIAHPEGFDDVWMSLMVDTTSGELNAYGTYTSWEAFGMDSPSKTRFACTWDNGALVFDNRAQMSPWLAINMFAAKLAHYARTEDVNLTHQNTPWLLTAPQEKQLELVNVYKQAQGGEPAILADDSLRDYMKVSAISTGVPYIANDLHIGMMNVWNDVYRFLGIDHLAFEKGERMIEEEAKGNSTPTTIKLMNCLKARRDAAEYLNAHFGLNIQVVFNDDIESYNFNYLNNAEMIDSVGGGQQ